MIPSRAIFAAREPTTRCAALLVVIGCGAFIAAARAQDNGATGLDATRYDDRLVEEIIVKGSRWRTPEVDAPKWRGESVEPSQPRRIKMDLGYDPVEARQLARDNPAYNFDPTGTTPATVIRFRF